MKFRPFVLLSLLAISALPLVAHAGRGDHGPLGPPGGIIYADGRMFHTIGTPAILPPHGQFMAIYVLGEPYNNVAEYAPGEPGFVGGRWEVRPITWISIQPQQFTSAAQVKAAAQAGQISIGEPVKYFECPLIPIN